MIVTTGMLKLRIHSWCMQFKILMKMTHTKFTRKIAKKHIVIGLE